MRAANGWARFRFSASLVAKRFTFPFYRPLRSRSLEWRAPIRIKENGFVASAKLIKSKGVDLIACTSVNDAFVMEEWNKTQGPAGRAIMMLADGNAEFAKAMDLVMDGTGIGFGTRSQRYSAIIENGVIKALNVEKPMKFEVSSAEAILQHL